MLRSHNCLISALRSMIRSRILAGLLCLFFLVSSLRMIPDSCSAFEREKPHKNHSHIALGIDWSHPSIPRIPLENRCPCSSSVGSCCMGPINSASKNSNMSLFYGDNLRRLSVLQATMIKPFDGKPSIQNDKCLHDFNSFNRKEVFLVNCTFLI